MSHTLPLLELSISRQPLPRLFSGREYPNTFCPGLSGYFVTFHPFGPNWPEAGKEETT